MNKNYSEATDSVSFYEVFNTIVEDWKNSGIESPIEFMSNVDGKFFLSINPDWILTLMNMFNCQFNILSKDGNSGKPFSDDFRMLTTIINLYLVYNKKPLFVNK